MELHLPGDIADLDSVLQLLPVFPDFSFLAHATPRHRNVLDLGTEEARELADLSIGSESSSPSAPASSSPDICPLPVRAADKARIGKTNLTHTRRCRAKVNGKLQELLSVLSEAGQAAGSLGVFGTANDEELEGAKHKAQILALTINRFHALRERNTELEMRLAMSSPHNMRRWVRSVVETTSRGDGGAGIAVKRMVPDIVGGLKFFMALICSTRSWKYAELWEPQSASAGKLHLKYRSGALPRSLTHDEATRVKAFRQCSRRFLFVPRSGVPGRVYLTKRPEWLPTLDDAVVFPRAPHAVAQRVQVTFAVPVIVGGEVRMIVEFYDTVHRRYDPIDVNMVNEIAAMFAGAFEERSPRKCAIVSERVQRIC